VGPGEEPFAVGLNKGEEAPALGAGQPYLVGGRENHKLARTGDMGKFSGHIGDDNGVEKPANSALIMGVIRKDHGPLARHALVAREPLLSAREPARVSAGVAGDYSR
jgi:hypothetical protein